jgi:hypothetical protein
LQGRGWALVDGYRVVFALYSVLGLVKLGMVAGMSKRCEVEVTEEEVVASMAEEEPLLADAAVDGESRGGGLERSDVGGNGTKKRLWRRALPSLSKESAFIVWMLSLLFGLDSFASGMASQ